MTTPRFLIRLRNWLLRSHKERLASQSQEDIERAIRKLNEQAERQRQKGTHR